MRVTLIGKRLGRASFTVPGVSFDLPAVDSAAGVVQDQAMTDEMLTTEQAAQELGVSAHAVRKMIDRGILKAEKFGPVWMIKRSQLSEVRDRRKPGRPPKN